MNMFLCSFSLQFSLTKKKTTDFSFALLSKIMWLKYLKHKLELIGHLNLLNSETFNTQTWTHKKKKKKKTEV